MHIVTVVSLAGAGKTALVRHWQQRMEQSGYRGAERVFAWSFYTERTRTDAGTPGDEFVHAALRWFGDPDPRDGSPWDKGVRLANLVRAQRSLLILDSLEPLQEPPTAARAGEIRDEAVATLVRELAVANSGLCLITTRTPVLDIAAYERSTAPSLTLRPLPDEEGAALLAALGVHGTEDERRSTSRWVLGHGLSLALLGRYVGRACNGAITGPTQALLQQAIQHEGGPVRGIVQEYERWLDEPSLAILRLLGLFDGPASQASLRALRASPPIAGLTEPLVDLEDSGWWIAVRQLLECGLASPGPGGDHALDLHPLIREHLAQDLPTRSTQAWREGNERLYRHFRDTSEDRPKSLEGMIPLFNAVTHGCRAGLHEECWTEVFWPRICREGREYLVNALGAVSAELAMLSRFLSEPCPTAAHDLRPAHRAWALVHAGLAHRHLGNMRDAEAAMVAGREVHEREGDSNGLTNACRHLGQLYCIMGRLNQALQSAREGVEAASQGCTRLEEIAAKATLAHIYLQRGDMRDAGQSFAAALETQKGAGLLPIFWLPEYRYCDFLLSEGRPSDALRIADLANGPHQRPAFRMGYYLGLLTMARARILLAQQGGPNDLSQAWDEVGQAVDGLREWGQQELLVPAFLTRAALLRIMRSYDRAHHDLSAATDIVTRGGMRLYEADCCLETARLRCAAGHQDAAKDLRRQASAMVDEMGYHRRDGEIADLQADLRITDPPR